MIGRTIAHYRIVEKLGAGGMGVVYLARDEQLERDVAIKFLPPGFLADHAARRRLRHEALTLARLHHPNIGVIYELGSENGLDFVVMEYVQGSTLSERLAAGPISEKQALAIAGQVAAALEEAHEKNVVHCDLKPSNVLLTPKGEVKVLDFGLARLARPVASDTTTESVEQPGAICGTLPYMAPEQLLGGPADPRTDIYAFGALLYEMTTGRRPFRQPVIGRLTDDILHHRPPAPRTLAAGLSPELERIISKCLEKSCDDRYQSARELSVDLRRLAAPALEAEAGAEAGRQQARRPKRLALFLALLLGSTVVLGLLFAAGVGRWRERAASTVPEPGIRSLAVLPMENLSGDPSQEYFADGITDELTTNLAHVTALRIISRRSAMLYKGKQLSAPAIARELKVDALVEGSVMRSGDRVRISAQLIDARSDRHLWAQIYEGNLRDILSLQDDLARAIANRIKVELTPQEHKLLSTGRPVNPAAQLAYLRGLYKLHGVGVESDSRRRLQDIQAAIGYFQQAITLDPGDAHFYAGLADAYNNLAPDFSSPLEVMPQAKAAAFKAIALDDTVAEAHSSLGQIEFFFDWDSTRAEGEFRKALALNPSLPQAHLGLAVYLMLAARRPDESIKELERAYALDPLVPLPHSSFAEYFYEARRFAESNEAAKRLGDKGMLALSYAALGLRSQTIAAADQAARSASSPVALAEAATAFALAGQKQRARKILHEVEQAAKKRYICGFNVACVYVALGDKSQAFAWLNRALLNRSD